MSQMTSLLKAEKAAWKGSVCVNTAMVTARNAQAPVGSGSKTSPIDTQQVKSSGVLSQLSVHGFDVICPFCP